MPRNTVAFAETLTQGGESAGAPPRGTPPAKKAVPASPTSTDGPPTASRLVEFSSWILVLVFALGSAATAIAATVANHKHGHAVLDSGRWWAISFGVGMVALVLLILQLLGQRPTKLGVF